MKKLLLLALLFAGVAVFAGKGGRGLVLEFYNEDATVTEKGDAFRVKDVVKKDGSKKSVGVYFAFDSEWKICRATVSSPDCKIGFRASKGGTYECKSIKINGKELLSKPVKVGKKKMKSGERLAAESADGKMEVVVEAREIESAN